MIRFTLLVMLLLRQIVGAPIFNPITQKATAVIEDDFEFEDLKEMAVTRMQGPHVISPVSTTVSLSPNPGTSQNKKSLPKKICVLETIPESLLLIIGEYLEFPHLILGSLSKDLRAVFASQSPSKMIASQLQIPVFAGFPKCNDLKYLIGLGSSLANTDDNYRLMMLTVDVALIKSLPVIKRDLLRFLYKKIADKPRPLILQNIHPFKNCYSPLGALISSFFHLKDYESVFEILKDFSELFLRPDLFLMDSFIEYAEKADKIEEYFELLDRVPAVDNQFKYDLTCKCLKLTCNRKFLNRFMQSAYKENEYWNVNYSETYLNAWIDAFTLGDVTRMIEPVADGLASFVEQMHVETAQVAIRKQTLLILIAIRSRDEVKTASLLGQLDFNVQFKEFNEIILIVLVHEEQYAAFFQVLDRMQQSWHYRRFESTELRKAIAKSKSDEFIEFLLERYNVDALFSSNLYGEAYYNKRLFFRLIHVPNEEAYLTNSLLNEQLFRYAIEHFGENGEEWEKIFLLRPYWSAVSFGELFSCLLKHLRSVAVFERILDLLQRGMIRIASWGRPKVHLDIESAWFLIENLSINMLIPQLRSLIDFQCEGVVMAELIASSKANADILKHIKFQPKDLFVQLGHWTDFEKFKRIFGWSDEKLANALRSAMKEMQMLQAPAAATQEEFDQSVMMIFNAFLEPLKYISPLKYLSLIPFSQLKRFILHEPDFMRRALLTGPIGLHAVFDRIRGNVIRVRGPFSVSAEINLIARSYRVRFEII